MAYLAKIEGTYKYRLRVKILWFWVVQPWKSAPFSWQQEVKSPELHLSYTPLKNIPLSVSLDVDRTIAHFGIRLIGDQEVWGETVHVPASLSQAFHFEPWKGAIVEGTARFVEG